MLLDGLALDLSPELDLFVSQIDDATAEIAVNFVSALLGASQIAIAQAIKDAFGLKTPSTIYNRFVLQREKKSMVVLIF